MGGVNMYDPWDGMIVKESARQYAKESEDRLMKLMRGEEQAPAQAGYSSYSYTPNTTYRPQDLPANTHRGIKITTHDDLDKATKAIDEKIASLDTYLRNEVAQNVRLHNRVTELEEQVKDLKFLLTELMEDM